MQRLKQRAEFLAAAAAARAPANGFVLQARRRDDEGPARFGFTASRKIGSATERNRARRRLRDVVRRTDAALTAPGHDYVLVARRAAITLSFERLMEDFRSSLRRIGREKGQRGRRSHEAEGSADRPGGTTNARIPRPPGA
ncbi:MAG: ribonuclease P protein component [Rhizobiales bacterium]|nr:ribonuclease P protein component [Hyphomicrobiales bacterium]